MEPQLFSFEFHFEEILQRSTFLHNLISPETIPYENKYKARKLLQKLRDDIQQENKENLNGIVEFMLGINFLETEENSQGQDIFYRIALIHLQKSLGHFAKLENPLMYLNYVQTIYNHLGYLAVNRDDDNLGIATLAKAEALGQLLLEEASKVKEQFRYFREGDLSYDKISAAYTITLFYLAQGYTKLQVKDKAAYYCGQTMQRQFASKQFDQKEWCINCISLSEYFYTNNHYSQAIYLLQSGQSLVPIGKKHKMHATFNMTMGKVIHELLAYSVLHLHDDIQNQQSQESQINKISVQFDGITVNPLKLIPCKDIESVRGLFRQANTLYKKSLQKFVLDGYVTEHIQIQQDISQMYNKLSYLENDIIKKLAILEKRRDLLEPIMLAINSKAYKATYEKLLVELAEIYNQEFESIFQHEFLDDKPKNKINKKNVDRMNTVASKAIKYYREIEEVLLSEVKENENQKNINYYQSVVNAKFNVSKALSKVYSPDLKQKIDYLVQSLENYKKMVIYIEQDVWAQNPEFKNKFLQEHNMCKEMVQLLPSKIDKLNNSA